MTSRPPLSLPIRFLQASTSAGSPYTLGTGAPSCILSRGEEMKRKVLSPKSIPARGKPYSQGFVVEARRTVFVAGQVPVDAEGETVGKGDIAVQTAQVFSNLGAVLEEAGAD